MKHVDASDLPITCRVSKYTYHVQRGKSRVQRVTVTAAAFATFFNAAASDAGADGFETNRCSAKTMLAAVRSNVELTVPYPADVT